jgi:subtilisin family serine protease
LEIFSLVFAAGLAIDPWALVRVEDPSHPDADAVSETGAVLLAPPAKGTPWRYEPVPEVDGWVGQEGIEAMNIASYHELGFAGAGVKVAVFDLLWFGSEADPNELGEVKTHDCYYHPSCDPPMDTWRPRFSFEEGVHGYACAEVIHDLAPDAELHLVRVNGFTSFENGVHWAIREGIDLISLSMSFYNDSFYDGTGDMAELIDELVAADVLLVTSAGNSAEQHWRGPYVDVDGDSRMDGDGQNGWWVYLNQGDAKRFYLNWDQYGRCGKTDLDLYLYDTVGYIVGRSESVQDSSADQCQPVERMRATIEEAGWYWLEVHHLRGPTVDLSVRIHARGGAFAIPVPRGSVADPGAIGPAFAVGATRAAGYLSNGVEGFSSWGPNAAGLMKPDIVGPDGLSTDAYGGRGFYGTSAAAPAVTGALAVLLSTEPALTPYEAADRLQSFAITQEPTFSQPDPRWGAGKARLPGMVILETGCGERPLIMSLFWLPLGLWRRRRFEEV